MSKASSDAGHWPVGIHLRFKPDAAMKPQFEYLRGTPVLVLGRPQMTTISDGDNDPSVRQEVFAYALGRTGAALPSQLEPIPGRRPQRAEPRSDDQRVEE